MKTTKRRGSKKAAKKPDPRLIALHEEVERIRVRAERIAREMGPALPAGVDKPTGR